MVTTSFAYRLEIPPRWTGIEQWIEPSSRSWVTSGGTVRRTAGHTTDASAIRALGFIREYRRQARGKKSEIHRGNAPGVFNAGKGNTYTDDDAISDLLEIMAIGRRS